MVGSRTNLPLVDKLQYLNNCLKGEAAKLLSNIPIQGGNYVRAWNRLRSRFDNKRSIIHAHLDRLHGLKPVPRECARGLEQLRSAANNEIEALSALILGTDSDFANASLIHLISKKLDAETSKAWQLSLGSSNTTTSYQVFDTFLEARIRALESIGTQQNAPFSKPQQTGPPRQQSVRGAHAHAAIAAAGAGAVIKGATAATKSAPRCTVCQENHLLFLCTKYQKKTPQQRYQLVTNEKRCLNCLGFNHMAANCYSKKICNTCQRKHHTTLHGGFPPRTVADDGAAEQRGAEQHQPDGQTSAQSTSGGQSAGRTGTSGQSGTTDWQESSSCPLAQETQARSFQSCVEPTALEKPQVLLATAEVRAIAPNGRELHARALLDQGSELSFASETLVQALRLKRRRLSIPLTGIGASKSPSTRGVVRLILRPHFESTESFTVEAHILPQVTQPIPPVPVLRHPWRHLTNLELADPNFATPGQVDILLGADIYGLLLGNDVIKGQGRQPVAQHTKLGWIVSGPTEAKPQSSNHDRAVIGMCAINQDLHELVTQFWEQERILPPRGGLLSEDDQFCENHFRETHSRDAAGRFQTDC